MLHPTVFNTAQICHQLGIKHAVMSPGSRNAPLTVSFARHEKIDKWIIPDERSAGFIALGIAQETKTPVVLCCTSGTALLNYAPAIAEAYYREIPLIVLSADRPPELIDQRDGQTIRQFEALKNHVKRSIQLPLISSESKAEEYKSSLVEAIKESLRLPNGPVHINIPFAEPFYPSSDQELSFQQLTIEENIEDLETESYDLDLTAYKKVLILIGQQDPDSELKKALAEVEERIPVLKFPLNNVTVGIEHVDLFINNQIDLKPDLLITSGLSVLSKKLKTFLRNQKPKRHLHFDPAGINVDTFQSNPEMIKSTLTKFLNAVDFSEEISYLKSWKSYEEKVKQALNDYEFQEEYSETVVAKTVLKTIPEKSNLHLSNSMPVRFADIFGVKHNIQCFSNRGTSGIDGCTSTAMGSALVSNELNILLTGDLAFLYDRNAFFHNYLTPNLRVIILNNQGGGIFRLIDGPSNLPELEDYFETRHNRTAEYICAENSLEYLTANDTNSLNKQLDGFYQKSSHAKVLEVFTKPETNQRVYQELKKHIYERIKN